MTKSEKGTYGYLDRNRKDAWLKAAVMLSAPIAVFLAAWAVNKTRMNVITVVSAVGCLPGCNQLVHAMIASRYHSIDRSFYEETEKARKDRMALYENVFTSYEATYVVDCLVISGREAAGYTSDKKTDAQKAQEHICRILKDNSYKQNVKIFTDRDAFLDRVRMLSQSREEQVPFNGDDRFQGMSRNEILRYLLLAVSL